MYQEEWIDLQSRISKLERSNRRCKGMVICSLILITASIGFASADKAVEAKSNGVLHARGLIIEDANGRARILLGAPFPSSRDRLRQDQTTQAMVFLDSSGHDRLTVGEATSAQIQGKADPHFKRIGDAMGVFLHDTDGNERGGYSWLSIGRGAMTLDRPTAEALGAFVDDKSGRAGMVFDYPGEVSPDASAIEIITKGTRGSISLLNQSGRPLALWKIDGNVVHPPQAEPTTDH